MKSRALHVALLLSLVLSYSPASTEASLVERCQYLLSGKRSSFAIRARESLSYGIYPGVDSRGLPVIHYRGAPYFRADDIERWVAAFSREEFSHPYYRSDFHGEVFWELVSRLPSDIIDDLKAFPGSFSEGRSLLGLLSDQIHQRAGLTFMVNFGDLLFSMDGPGMPSFGSWIDANLGRHSALSAEQRTVLVSRILEAHQSHLADLLWSADLPVSFTLRQDPSGAREELVIGDRIYPVLSRFESSVVVLTPRSRMRHPAWNPVSLSHLLELAQAKETPSEVYRVDLAIDGFLDIDDGNHRFELDSRQEIPVQVVFPVRVNLRRSMAAMGYNEAGSARTCELIRQGRPLIELLPQEIRGRILPEVRTYLESTSASAPKSNGA